jgi:hypothetical protein
LQTLDPAVLLGFEQQTADGLEQGFASTFGRRIEPNRHRLGLREAAALQHVLDRRLGLGPPRAAQVEHSFRVGDAQRAAQLVGVEVVKERHGTL